jgi:hypothetical protein
MKSFRAACSCITAIVFLSLLPCGALADPIMQIATAETTDASEVPETTTTSLTEATTTTAAVAADATTTTTEAPPPPPDPTTTTTTEAPPPPPDPTTTTTTTTMVRGPIEVFREVVTLARGDLWGTDFVPFFLMSISSQGFATSHPWWLVATTPPGPEGCRDSTVRPVGNPASLEALTLSTGWYGCTDVEGEYWGQLQLIDIQPGDERMIVELVLWDFTP